MITKTITRLFSLACAASVLGAAFPARADITVKGSDTLVILAQKWAEVYMGKNPGQKIQVTGGGTGTGFAALQNQSTDLCNASRKIKAKEIETCVKAFGKRPTEYKVAVDGLSVYVSADNAVKELTLEQLEFIFTGKLKNWKDVGGSDAPITVYSRENSSGTYEFFRQRVLANKDFKLGSLDMNGSKEVVELVGNTRTAIGYSGMGYATDRVKMLRIIRTPGERAVAPTIKDTQNKTYPLARSLLVYTLGEPQGAVKKYIEWMLSAQGQKIVEENGYVPQLAENAEHNSMDNGK